MRKKARSKRKLGSKRFRELSAKTNIEFARLAIKELKLDDRIRKEAMRLERSRKVDYVR